MYRVWYLHGTIVPVGSLKSKDTTPICQRMVGSGTLTLTSCRIFPFKVNKCSLLRDSVCEMLHFGSVQCCREEKRLKPPCQGDTMSINE